MINVCNYDGEVIGQVAYNQDLDYWDGNNWTSGGTGHHKGLTRLVTGEYVLIHGTDWQGQQDYAEVITPEQALQEILKAGATELLDKPMFKELAKLREETIVGEWKGEE